MSEIKKISLCLLGNSAVGKTCVISRYVNPDEPFNPETLSTIGVSHFRKTAKLKNGKNIVLQIFDPCGQERFHSLTKSFYQNVAGVILIYAINDREAFEKISDWILEVKNNAPEGCQMILIGNKKDLENNEDTGNNENTGDNENMIPLCRVISEEEGKKVAQENGLDFFEVSAKTGEGIEKCFETIIEKSYNIKVQQGIEIQKIKEEKKKKCLR